MNKKLALGFFLFYTLSISGLFAQSVNLSSWTVMQNAGASATAGPNLDDDSSSTCGCDNKSTNTYSYTEYNWSGSFTGDGSGATVSLDTSAVGRHTVSVDMTNHYTCDADGSDSTGNGGSASASYTVLFSWGTPPTGLKLRTSGTGQAAIDNDGDPNCNKSLDPYWQPTTSWEPNGQPVDASTTPYVVASQADQKAGVQLGDWALVTNTATNQQVWARVADNGPDQSVVEVSNAAASAVGIDHTYTSATGNISVQFYCK